MRQIKDYMIKTEFVTPQEDVSIVIDKLLKHRSSGFPVIDNNKLVGFISEKDCMKPYFNCTFDDAPCESVKACMSASPLVIKEFSPIMEALNLFINHSIRVLVVVNDNNDVVGVFRREDLLRAIKELEG